MKKNFLRVISFALFLPAIALAHAGGRDIRGTLMRFDKHDVVVKLATGDTETVPLTESTTYRVGASAGTSGDMHEGSRVVVHIGHDGKAIEIHLPSRK
jgi:hypothetical protein